MGMIHCCARTMKPSLSRSKHFLVLTHCFYYLGVMCVCVCLTVHVEVKGLSGVGYFLQL